MGCCSPVSFRGRSTVGCSAFPAPCSYIWGTRVSFAQSSYLPVFLTPLRHVEFMQLIQTEAAVRRDQIKE